VIEQELFADLNEAQRDAVTCVDGPLLILAAAGSGKTRVITRRVAYLLHLGVHAGNVLAITFTNKAAGEMQKRVAELMPGNRTWISTFHSFGARLLRQYADRLGLDRNFTIYDQTDRLKVVKLAIEDVNREELGRFSPDSLMGLISKAKNQLISAERYGGTARTPPEIAAARVYPYYEKRLRDANALDFDDLLYWPALALKHDQELRAELDARFKYVMVDEYQDTNHAQYEIVRRLSIDHPNVCVVGDPDQSIYKFRGSDIRNILDFERDFPQAKVMTLSLNYRSTKSILAAADGLIAHNTQRKPKDLITDNPAGKKVSVLVYATGSAEADDVIKRIRRAVENGDRKYRDFAILVRMNALTRALESACIQQRVPYQIVKGLAFFERKENRDVLAYLRLLVNPRDDVSFERVVNEPPRGIGETTLKHLRTYAAAHEISLLAACNRAEFVPQIKGKGVNALRNFGVLMQGLSELRDATPDEVIRQVLEKSGYRQALIDSRDEEDAQRLANVEELITAAHQFGQDDHSRTIGDFLENVTLASDLDGWDQNQDCVSIMTMHAAKGLEFPVVFLVAVEQGLIPHVRALESRKEDEIEEERRLAFVGMTRAQKELFLTRAREREFRGQTNPAVESMFLRELPEEAISVEGDGGSPQDRYRVGHTAAAREAWNAAGIELPLPRIPPTARGDDPYPVGALVRHASYGVGRVTKLDGYGATRSLTIRFPAGEHKFRLSHVKLELIRPA
jgi:DNA helicase II / ATP-dependent DNA helicase PcrA